MRKLLLSLLLLTGCFRPCGSPNLCMPEKFTEGDYIEPCGGDFVDLLVWWEQFEDPLLTELIERSISCNLDLRIAQERICEARAIFGIEFSKLLPHIDEVSTIDRMRNSRTLAEAPFLGGTFVNFYKTGFDTNWDIDLWGKQLDRARASVYDVIAEQESVRNMRLALASEVAATYFLIRNLQERIEITRTHILTEQNLVEIAQDRFDGGLVPLVDVYIAKGLLDSHLSILPEQEEKLTTAIYSMAILLAKIPEEMMGIFSEVKPVPCTNGKVPLGLPSELLCRRGDVRAAELHMSAAGARVLAARKEIFPDISLHAFYQMATGFFTKWFNQGSKQWTLSPFISLPLFRGGQIRSQIQAETSLQRQAVFAYEQSILIALKEVESSLNAYFKRGENFYSLINEVDDYLEARNLAQTLYTSGLVDFLYVIDSQRDLYVSQIRLSESKELLSTNLVAIYKALGGGWECSSTL